MLYLQASPSLTCMESIKTCFSKYCTFTGRARRSEFWYFLIFCHVVAYIFAIIFVIILFLAIIKKVKRHNGRYYDDDDYYYEQASPAGLVISILLLMISELALLIPIISVSVRRLHDTGRSGCFYFLNFLPFGFLCLLIFYIEDSQQEMNEYGPSPKYFRMQDGGVVNNQIIPVGGMIPPNPAYPQAYPQYGIYPQAQEPPVQQNLYQAPAPMNPQLEAPMVSNNV